MRYTFLLLILAAAARGQDVDSPMFRDPVIRVADLRKTFHPRLVELWLIALNRPEAEMRAEAARAITAAHQQGMTGLGVAVEPLRRELDKPGQHPDVRLAVARALSALDAKAAAESLLNLSRDHVDLREVADPALARWDHPAARAEWLSRVREEPFRRGQVLAVQSLAAVGETKAVPRLRELLSAPALSPASRLEVARAMGTISPTGLEADARQLTADPLAAVTLLRRHSGADAIKLLQDFAKSAEAGVAAVAAARLVELDPKHLTPALDAVLANADPAARELGVEALLKMPSEDHVKKLGVKMADVHPAVRAKARRALVDLAAAPALRPAVLAQGMQALTAPDWRGQEQAALLLGKLKHTPAAPALVTQLTAARPEAFVAAAWGLREVADPATLPAALALLAKLHAQVLKAGGSAGVPNATPIDIDRQMSQLAQFMGQEKYAPAEKTLLAIAPRFLKPGIPPAFTPVGGESRAASIWALGRLLAGNPRADAVALIELRLTGDGMLGPDDERVRRMSAVALVRMAAKSSLPAVESLTGGPDPTPDPLANTCRWAVAELTGRPLAPPGVKDMPQREWFLIPLK